jgi:hypothetical protein
MLFLLIPFFLILTATTIGPPAGYTGSPLDGQDCTACHLSLPPGHLPNWIATDIPAGGYMPGETYNLTLTAIGLVAVKMGFQVTAETVSAKAGTFIITDPTRTKLADPYTVTHTAAGTEVTSLPCTWSMQWQAPPAGTGAVTFHAIVNQSDNNNNNSGDLFYASEFTVTEATVGIAGHESPVKMQIYPNPATDRIQAAVPQGTELRIISMSGVELFKGIAENPPVQIRVAGFPRGNYLLLTRFEGKENKRMITIK